MRRLAPMLWLGTLLAAMAVAATLGAQTASAHATRVSAEPADNAMLTAGPAQVSATFNERLQTTFAAMAVVGPDGNVWSTGAPTVQGAVVSVELRPLGPTGTYTSNYRVTSADGHVVSGSWSFRLTVPGTGSPGPAASAVTADSDTDPHSGPNSDQDLPTWPFAVGAVVAVGVGALWATRRRP
ncbi:copper resistance CopC family protein [Mycobacterium sp.]|uniref:copper resistance CopC family protein n=1 Tax=Mycobacterium sp. TaxID=1785 RepID=UPI003C793B97